MSNSIGVPVVVGTFVALVSLGCWLMLKVSRHGNELLRRRAESKPVLLDDVPYDGGEDHTPRREPFGYKTGWIAIRTDETQRVVDGLGIRNATPMGWVMGVKSAYDCGLFVTPPIDGWTLVMGAELADGSPSAKQLSDQLRCEVQVFASYRVSEFHCWERASDALEYRHFTIDDGEVTTEGVVTEVEHGLGIDRFIQQWTADDPDFEADDIDIPDEDTVMAVAAAWSVDPTTLDGPDDRLGWYSPSGIRRSLTR